MVEFAPVAEEDPEVAALRAKLDQELSRPPPKNELGNTVAFTAVKTVIGITVSLIIGGWIFSTCFGG